MELWKLDKVIEDLVSHFASSYSGTIQESHIFDALTLLLSDKHEFEWGGDLWGVDIEYEEALKLLSDFDFSNLLRGGIETEKDIIPKNLFMMYKARLKSKNLIWEIHKYDADPFPSNPHAHELDNNIKLDLSNGKCYKIRKHIHTINKKSLISIRDAASKVYKGELPLLAI